MTKLGTNIRIDSAKYDSQDMEKLIVASDGGTVTLVDEIHCNDKVIQDTKAVTINENTETEILPDDGYDLLERVVVTTDIPEPAYEENVDVTIFVPNYNEPMEIEPSEGYDAMSKVTISLANIPTAFYMYASDGTNVDMITNVRPEDVVLDNPIKIRRAYNNEYLYEDAVVTGADDTSITVTANAFEATYIFIGALNI